MLNVGLNLLFVKAPRY